MGGDHTGRVQIYLWNLRLWEETILGEFTFTSGTFPCGRRPYWGSLYLPLEPPLVGGDHSGRVHIYLWNLPLWEETILGEFIFTSGTFPCGRRPYWESSHLPLEPSLVGGDHTGRVHIYLWNLPLWEETILGEFTFTSGTFPCGRRPYWESSHLPLEPPLVGGDHTGRVRIYIWNLPLWEETILGEFTFTSGTVPCGRRPYWESSHLPLEPSLMGGDHTGRVHIYLWNLPLWEETILEEFTFTSGTFPCGRRPYWESSHLPLEPPLVGGDHTGRVHIYLWNLPLWEETILGEFTFTSGTFPCGRRPYWESSHLPLEPSLVGGDYTGGVHIYLWNLPLWEETILGEFIFTSGTFPCGRRPYWESSHLPLEPSLVGGDHTGRVYIYLWNLPLWEETILGEFTFTSGTFPCGRRPYWESLYLPLEPSLVGGDHTGRVYIYLWNLPLWEETILGEFTFTSGTFPCGRRPYWESLYLPLEPPLVGGDHSGRVHIYLWNLPLWEETILGEFIFTSGTSPCGRRPFWESSHLPLEPSLVVGDHTGRVYIYLWNLPLWEETILEEFTFTS